MAKREATAHPNIFRYPDGTFYFRRGTSEFSLRTKEWKAAVRAVEIAIKRREQREGLSRRLKFEEAWPEYWEHKNDLASGSVVGKRKLRAGTLREINYIMTKHLLPFFGNTQIFKIDEDTWDLYCAQATVGDLSNHRKVLTTFLKWCKRKHYIKLVPQFEIPQVRRRPRRILKEHEILALFKSAEGALLLFLSMALFMGMRRSEIMGLRWDQVHLDEGFLELKGDDTKTNRGRVIPLNPRVKALLEARPRRAGSAYVFPNAADLKRPAHPDGLKTAWHTCKRRAGLGDEDITWHDLRATGEKFAHASRSFTESQLEKFFGSSIDVQRRIYVKFDADDLRGIEQAVDVPGLGELFEAKKTRSE